MGVFWGEMRDKGFGTQGKMDLVVQGTRRLGHKGRWIWLVKGQGAWDTGENGFGGKSDKAFGTQGKMDLVG